ncbi:hypothetical protein BIFCAT_01219 [Bifidobacterium catenulatum DSM 16992 = JCM 1194 = LMG 11043]|uniref:Uncharacterized protein n=1 Tax=Bifidobacterium catenulatum DSM 16992 = JCM 1194 = LMG 11043 TaxID=566552 RepID=B6XVJ0_9BIFI|nr:hypothetical protein BIFCAT_01219 [Bifidobacterium catenulatum DSM 16992 = JCM 1194 = LMG 11043]
MPPDSPDPADSFISHSPDARNLLNCLRPDKAITDYLKDW